MYLRLCGQPVKLNLRCMKFVFIAICFVLQADMSMTNFQIQGLSQVPARNNISNSIMIFFVVNSIVIKGKDF